MDATRIIGGRYQLLAVTIGQGSMGTVFRGIDLGTRADVAIKLLRAEAIRDPGGVERFTREGDALRSLDHPSIVRMLASLDEGDDHYLVMEFVAGGSLEATLKAAGGGLGVQRTLAVGLDLSDALTRAHHLGIVHRDLKPSNVLIAEDGTPRLTDFGVAYIVGKERISQSGAVIGTLDYLSPEALAGETVDARSDVWALGALLFEMLTGRPPFANDHVAATLNAILTAPPPPLESLLPDCPTGLVDLVYRMLEKDRNQRIPTARRVGAELERILADEKRKVLGSRGAPLDPIKDVSRQGDVGFASTLGLSAHRTSGRGPSARPLPLPATPFVGRVRELAALARLLLEPPIRLITIVGPGGIGKTRLALEAARLCEARAGAFALTGRGHEPLGAGVCFVDLAPLVAAELVASEIADTLGFQFYPGGDPEAQLVRHLRSRNVLIVLDNFEHVLASAGLLSEILQSAHGVKVLATSREPIGLQGETAFQLSGLDFPPTETLSIADDFSSLTLLTQSARRVRFDFELTPETAPAAVRICRTVQGMPLGIVLAAAWVGQLSLAEIADEIDAGLDFLATDMSDVPERQRSVRSVFDHSFRFLGQNECRVLARLAVFRGGFTRDAAEAVAGADLRTLARLMKQSMLTREPASGRYAMHSLLRQYAESRLAEQPQELERAQTGHAHHYADFLWSLEPGLKGLDPGRAAGQVESELDNIRAAWCHLLRTERWDRLGPIMETLDLFYRRRALFAEGEAVFQAAVEALCPHDELAGEAGMLASRALRLRNTHRRQRGQLPGSEDMEFASRLVDPRAYPHEAALGWLEQGIATAARGELRGGIAKAEQGIELYRTTSDHWGLAEALDLVATLYGKAGDRDAEERAYRESIGLQRALGNGAIVLPFSLTGLGYSLAMQGQYAEGCRLMREGLALVESQGDVWNRTRSLVRLASAERALGNYLAAEAHARECLLLSRQIGSLRLETWTSSQLGAVLMDQGRYGEAELEYRNELEFSRECGDVGYLAMARLDLGRLALAREGWDEARGLLASSLAEFEQLGQAWGIVGALSGLGRIASHLQQYVEAREHFAKALELAVDTKAWPMALDVCAGIARLLARTGEPVRATEILALVERHPATERRTLVRDIEPLRVELLGTLHDDELSAAVGRAASLEVGQILRALSPPAICSSSCSSSVELER